MIDTFISFLSKPICLHIEADIHADFEAALVGIKQLPKNSRLGVYAAYRYYTTLFQKIKMLSAQRIMKERIRVPDPTKIGLWMQTMFRKQLNYI